MDAKILTESLRQWELGHRSHGEMVLSFVGAFTSMPVFSGQILAVLLPELLIYLGPNTRRLARHMRAKLGSNLSAGGSES